MLSGTSKTSPAFSPQLLLAALLKANASTTRRATHSVSVFIQMEETVPTQTTSAWPCTSAVAKMMPRWSGQPKTDKWPLLPWIRTQMQNWGCLLQEVSPQVSPNPWNLAKRKFTNQMKSLAKSNLSSHADSFRFICLCFGYFYFTPLRQRWIEFVEATSLQHDIIFPPQIKHLNTDYEQNTGIGF